MERKILQQYIECESRKGCVGCPYNHFDKEDYHCPDPNILEIAKYALALFDENERLNQWVNDLQSGMYVNCVYCGHRYGPAKDTPVSMADVLKKHIENCSKHPMSKLKQDNARKDSLLRRLEHASYDDCKEPICPICHEEKPKHEPDCELAKELKDNGT